MVQPVVFVPFLVSFAAVEGSPQGIPGCGAGGRPVFEESGNGESTDRWFLECERAGVEYVNEALELGAGATPRENESRAVL
jgi:hypothetical protein